MKTSNPARKRRSGPPAWAFLALFFPCLLQPGQAAALRCRWLSPNGGELDLVFAGKPLVVVPGGGNVEISPAVPPGAPAASIAVLRDGQVFREDRTLLLAAPDRPGAYYLDLIVVSPSGRANRELCILVPYPAAIKPVPGGLELSADGEYVGRYPLPERSGNAKVREHADSYRPPAWWLRITDANQGFEAVPGLKVGDLVQPPEEGGARHSSLVPVHHPLWVAVHTLRNALESKGMPGKSLRIISMFRAPSHNRRVGSGSYGRHIYGDACDFYIAGGGDGLKAADLNRDGRLDRRDAYPVVALIEDLQAEGRIPMGGIGVYNVPGGDHEVTLHLDLRGHRATWGYLTSPSGRRSEFAWSSRRFAELDALEERKAAEQAAKEGRVHSPAPRERLP